MPVRPRRPRWYDLAEQLLGRQPGRGADFVRPQFGDRLRRQFGRQQVCIPSASKTIRSSVQLVRLSGVCPSGSRQPEISPRHPTEPIGAQTEDGPSLFIQWSTFPPPVVASAISVRMTCASTSLSARDDVRAQNVPASESNSIRPATSGAATLRAVFTSFSTS